MAQQLIIQWLRDKSENNDTTYLLSKYSDTKALNERMKKLVNDLVKSMVDKNLKLALAESITCGLASHQLNIVKGTSAMFMGSIVCYNEKVKTDLLGVSPSLIKKYTAESQQVTDDLSKKLKRMFDADIYGAITGLASPDGSETKEKPVGSVFFSVRHGKDILRLEKKFNGSPLEIKKKAVENLYRMILDYVRDLG